VVVVVVVAVVAAAALVVVMGLHRTRLERSSPPSAKLCAERRHEVGRGRRHHVFVLLWIGSVIVPWSCVCVHARA
jgi:hypothetical protein